MCTLQTNRSVLFSHPSDSLIVFDERVTFGFNASGHCLVRVRTLHYLRVGSRITFTQSHTQKMQQTRSHKAVTGRVEAKFYSLVEGNRSLVYRKVDHIVAYCDRNFIRK